MFKGFLVLFSGFYISFPRLADAQVISDFSVNTQVDNNTTEVIITGGKQVDSVLLHSFSEFSSPKNSQKIIFKHEKSVPFIFSRVTGSSASRISSDLEFGQNTSLILLNPNGFSFLSNNPINISGSLVLTTAKDINFNGNNKFGVTNLSDIPSSIDLSDNSLLQFELGPLENSSVKFIDLPDLAFSPKSNLAIVASEIVFDNSLVFVPEGELNLISLQPSSTFDVTIVDNKLKYSYQPLLKYNDILIDFSLVTTADFVNFIGKSGNINVYGKDINLVDFSNLDASTFGGGIGGNISIHASNIIKLNDSVISAGNEGNDEPGSISLYTKDLVLENGSFINAIASIGTGDGGNINVDASGIVKLSGTEEVGFSQITTQTFESPGGDAGNISIRSRDLLLQNGGLISTNTLGSGNAGEINIDVERQLTIKGSVFQPFLEENIPSRIFSGTSGNSSLGNGRSINISAHDLTVSSQGFISAEATEEALGESGSVSILVDDTLVIDNSGKISVSTSSPSPAGDLEINAKNLLLFDRSTISSSSTKSAAAGNLEIEAELFVLDLSSNLLSETTGGQGNINLESNTLFLNRQSQISANALNNVNGGNIDIVSGFLLGLGDSDITANAVIGNGGNIDISTNVLSGFLTSGKLTNFSDIVASSKFGSSGIVNLQVVEDPNAAVVELPSTIIDPTDKLGDTCSRANSEKTQRNTFSSLSRDGIVLNPNGALQENLIKRNWIQFIPNDWNKLTSFSSQVESSLEFETLPFEADTWVKSDQGKVQLISKHYLHTEFNKYCI